MFQDDFKDMSHWVSEGPHVAEVKDGHLRVKTVDDSRKVGQYVWCRHEPPDDFRAEFDVTPVSASGFFLIFFSVRGVDGNDILAPALFDEYMNWKAWKQYEDWDKYTSPANRGGRHRGLIRGYHVSYRRNESATCNCRKNPGLVLVKSGEIDALLPKDKPAHVVLTKQGGRIVLTVNGMVFMDYTDPNQPWTGGRFGFRNTYDSEALYEKVRMYELPGK